MENKDIIEQTVTSFIDIIDYAIDITVTYNKEDEIFNVDMQGENLGALIGYHGKNIASVELIINLMLNNKTPTKKRLIHIDINRYIRDRLDTINRIALDAINKVEKTGEPYTFSPMTAYERLQIHTLVGDHFSLISESVGEEPRRAVTIKTKGSAV